jgi:NADH-quinone oxidoreductase subunit F
MQLAEFIRYRDGVISTPLPEKTRVYVGMGTCGIAAGAEDLWAELKSQLEGTAVEMVRVGCIGMCEKEALVDVEIPSKGRFTYGNVTKDMIERIVLEHIKGGTPITKWLIGTVGSKEAPYKDLGFYSKQRRVVLQNCGFIDPERVEDYIRNGGYGALIKALSTMSPDDVVSEVQKSGLRGRGGAGFPTGLKWKFARQSAGTKKYIVCNGDEGDPGAFMDRSVLEGDPHAVLEGMMIAAYAIGADEGYLYVRAEYPLAIEHLKTAIKQATDLGLLGPNILGTGRALELKIKEGAGAFVCGEETALFASIEGERGMPRPRPPFPAEKGLWGKPTNNNNVETYANVPSIIGRGGDWFASMGTEKSKGSKVFALTGKIKNTGLAEVPMGISLREIIYDIGGGIKDNLAYKAVQIGGPSGGCLPAHLLETSVDYDSLIAAGAMMGSGGLVVLDERTCMVDLARYFLNFTQSESCGKCTPCREGTKRMLEILTRICDGEGKPEDIPQLEQLAYAVKDSSLCGLGQTAPNPVLSTLQYFRDEYEAHVNEKRCPAGACKALIAYSIDPEKCKACGMCKKVCPTGAITGEPKVKHTIDPALCIKCGSCFDVCKFKAVVR